MWCGKEIELSMRTGDADRRAGMPGAFPAGSGRNPQEEGTGASRGRARSENSEPKVVKLMEEVVERVMPLHQLCKFQYNT